MKGTKTIYFIFFFLIFKPFFSYKSATRKNTADQPVIIIPPPALLAATSHLAFVLDLSSGAHFDRRVLQSDGLQNNFAATLLIQKKKKGTDVAMRIRT